MHVDVRQVMVPWTEIFNWALEQKFVCDTYTVRRTNGTAQSVGVTWNGAVVMGDAA